MLAKNKEAYDQSEVIAKQNELIQKNAKTKEAHEVICEPDILKYLCGHTLEERASILKSQLPLAKVDRRTIAKEYKNRSIRKKRVIFEKYLSQQHRLKEFKDHFLEVRQRI